MSLLCTIPQLYEKYSNCDEGTEVRLLGYVEFYNPETGMLRLAHPTAAPKTHAKHREQQYYSLLVDISFIANDLDLACTSYGEYIHVIGYVRHTPSSNQQQQQDPYTLRIEAVTIWNAGNFDIQYWQRVMDLRSRDHQVDAGPNSK